MNKSHLLAVAAAACAVSVVGAVAPAAAAENVTRDHFAFNVGPVATCEGGADVTLGFDLTRNIHTYTDRQGNVIRTKRNVNYIGTFELVTTGEQWAFQGTRVATEDLVAGTFTSVGNYRTLTQPGSGVVLHSAGRELFESDTLLSSSGPKYDELSDGAQADICGLFGLDAA
jgi:hypothetical protein